MLASALVAVPVLAEAQFLRYLPRVSNYIRGDVRAENGGLSFRYYIQDSSLQLANYIIHTDAAGTPQWMIKAGNNFGDYHPAPDSGMHISGGYRNSMGNNIAQLRRVDKNGNLRWKRSYSSSGADIGARIVPTGRDTVYAVFSRSAFISSTYYSRTSVAALNDTGGVIWTQHIGSASLTSEFGFARAMTAANGDFLGVADVRGSSGAQANAAVVTRISAAGSRIFTRSLNFLPTHSQASVNVLAETPSGNIILGGRLMTDQISSTTNTMWLAKLDASGNLIAQHSYHSDTLTGEQLHGIAQDGNTIYLYVQRLSATDTTAARGIWVGVLDEATMKIASQQLLKLPYAAESPYGDDRNGFAVIGGKPVVAAGVYCDDIGRYIPLMMQLGPLLGSSCAALEYDRPFVDSTTSYAYGNYVTAGSFSMTGRTDTASLGYSPVAPFPAADLCLGCSGAGTGVSVPKFVKAALPVLFPNPGDGRFSISLPEPASEGRFSVRDQSGRTLYQQAFQGISITADISLLIPGIYFIEVRNADGAAWNLRYVRR